MTEKKAPEGAEQQAIIKKYANRRLYNTATSRYVTLEQLSEMVKEGHNFAVFDAKTGEDITRSVLTQIIFEEEGKQGQTLLPVNFLRQLISMYGNAMQPFVPNYLESMMDMFQKNHEAIREKFTGVLGAVPALKPFEELAKQNLSLMEKAVQRFSPFQMAQAAKEAGIKKSEGGDEMADLKARIDAMQKQLDVIAKGQRGDKD